MKFNIAIILFWLFLTPSLAQKRNAIWCFGDSAGIDFNDPLNPIPISTGLSPKGSCVSISDTAGKLLFYAGADDNEGYINGLLQTGIVYNRNHNKMKNGDSLNCVAWYHELVIVPDPGNNNIYYLFHIGVTSNFGLYYSVIDLNQDGGLGEVVSKNNVLDTLSAVDCLQAVKHGNGKDWWLIYKPYGFNNYFEKYLITSDGVKYFATDSVGIITSSNAGDLKFNSEASRFVFCNWRGALALYNFDRCTGKVTASDTIRAEDPGNNYPYYSSCAFSPNDSILYVTSSPYFSSLDTTQIYLYQFNLYALNILTSRRTIYHFEYPVFPLELKLGPDEKIYLATNPSLYPYDSSDYYQSNMNLSVINQPNRLSSFCDFQPYSFYLGGKRSYWGLPNNPNYDLAPVDGSLCDTVFDDVSELTIENIFHIYPNPFQETINIFSDSEEIFLDLTIFNETGKEVFNSKSYRSNSTINLSKLHSGIYFVNGRTKTRIFHFKIIKI